MNNMFGEQRLRRVARIYTRNLDPPLEPGATFADELRALEDQQLFLEQYDIGREVPSPGRLSPGDIALLASMRARYPSAQDRVDAAPYETDAA